MDSFCPYHQDECSGEEQSVLQLHRDIIHTLIRPLFEIHDHAFQIAKRASGRRPDAEPERAFRGAARGAFSWLHCILTEERDFSRTEGCPACVVLHVLHSEPTIRLLAVACQLRDSLPVSDLTHGHEGLPDFGFFMRALERAVREDALWGDHFWPEIESRARRLNAEIQQLIMQGVALRNGAAEPQKPSSKPSGAISTRPDRQVVRVHVRSSIPVEASVFARRQLHMAGEERELASPFLLSCWTSMCWNDRRRKLVEFTRPTYRGPTRRDRSVAS
jgi:hypothetical protein